MYAREFIELSEPDDQYQFDKGSVKLIQRVKIDHSLLLFVKSVPRYHF